MNFDFATVGGGVATAGDAVTWAGAAAAGGTGRLLRLLLLELAQTGTGAWAVDPRVGDARGLSPACLVPPACTGALSLLRGVEHCWAYGTAASAGACAWAVTKRELRDFAVRAPSSSRGRS